MGFIYKVFCLCLCFVTIFISSVSYAGDIMPAGTVLDEESYVFTVDEAKDLLKRIEELEIKEEKLNYYLELEPIKEEKFRLNNANIDLYKFQITEYDRIVHMNRIEIDRLQKREKWRWLENYGMLFLGVAITTGGFLATDAITDHMESN